MYQHPFITSPSHPMSTSNNPIFEFTINYNGNFILNQPSYHNGSHLKIKLPEICFEDMRAYLNRKLPTKVNNLYYSLPQNNTLVGMKAIKNDYDIDVMYDIARVAGHIQIFVSEQPIDFGTLLIPDDGSFEESFASIISQETRVKREERVRYLHEMVQRKNKHEDRARFKIRCMKKTKPTTPYTQTSYTFIVHNNGKLVCNEGKLNYVNGWKMHINIPRMKLEEMKQYLYNIVGIKIHALYYEVPDTGFSITVKLRNNYDMHVMFDISAALGKLQIFIDHGGVDFVIAKYVCPNATLAKMMDNVITDYISDNDDGKTSMSQSSYTLDQMVEWAEQEHFENEDAKEVARQKSEWKTLFRFK